MTALLTPPISLLSLSLETMHLQALTSELKVPILRLNKLIANQNKHLYWQPSSAWIIFTLKKKERKKKTTKYALFPKEFFPTLLFLRVEEESDDMWKVLILSWLKHYTGIFARLNLGRRKILKLESKSKVKILLQLYTDQSLKKKKQLEKQHVVSLVMWIWITNRYIIPGLISFLAWLWF